LVLQDSDSDSDSSDEEEEKTSEESSSSEESAASATQGKKRKAEDEAEAPAKKAKSDLPENASATLFVGSLSWNIDEDWLRTEFEEFGEIAGCRIVTDRDSGRSKG